MYSWFDRIARERVVGTSKVWIRGFYGHIKQAKRVNKKTREQMGNTNHTDTYFLVEILGKISTRHDFCFLAFVTNLQYENP
jgi:hypothetical protein